MVVKQKTESWCGKELHRTCGYGLLAHLAKAMGPLLSAEPQRPFHILEVVDYDAAHVESVDPEEMFPEIRAAGATIKCIKSAGVYFTLTNGPLLIQSDRTGPCKLAPCPHSPFFITIGPIIPFPQMPCPSAM
jgi:hypothetical protein